MAAAAPAETSGRTKVRVLVVDDSAVVRQLMAQSLARDPRIELTATASDPSFAWQKMQARWPDVIVLDIETPRMDGLSFLRRVMSEHPTPVVICSSLAESDSRAIVEAMEAGAVAIAAKPKGGLNGFADDSAKDLLAAIHGASRANPAAMRRLASPPVPVAPKLDASAVLPLTRSPQAMATTSERVIAIGTSTGGTQALEAVLTQLPVDTPGLVIVQHMPEQFTPLFADRLNTLCRIEVREAKKGDRVLPGLALIAPGGRHMTLRRNGAQFYVDVFDGPLVNRHKPSVDVLFRSVAGCAGSNAVGVIMTGMGDDGARGLKEMRDAGAATLAQDEASCVVFGMPKEAIRLGGAEEVVSLQQMASAMLQKVAME